ncbi:MAG: NAD(P)/FAD-dependent oxidoreductase [Chloroflexi bacterium]|nr:NAD(P)/FAD-dependent oxidoreductase [Chloroflexota bacterium]
MNVAIIGGGLAGLTTGYELAKVGHQVTILEKRSTCGGQVGTFTVGGGRLEVFYHHIFWGDGEVIRLASEFGLADRLQWLDSRVGFYHRGKIYNFVTPLDLLRFRPVSLLDRLRLGLVGMYLRRYRDWQRLEGLTAREWIIRWAGRRNYEVVWGPLLRGKFGEMADQVSMVWFWGKIHQRFASRGRLGQREKLGYLRGSFGLMVDALVERIQRIGGHVLTASPAARIRVEGGRAVGVDVVGQGMITADRVIATVPSSTLLGLAPEISGDYRRLLEKARYQWAACLVLAISQPISPIYWLNISDPSIPFVAAIEHTNFISPAEYGGKHVLYLTNYVAPESPLTTASAKEVLKLYLPHLKKINPSFQERWVQEYHLFRDPAGQPMVGVNYSSNIPAYRTPIAGLYLANTTQIYPQDRGMNYSLRLGLAVARAVLGDMGREGGGRADGQ